VERHFADERYGVIERSQKYGRGIVARVVIEEAQTTAPYPGTRVGHCCQLHFAYRKLGDEPVPLLIGQRAPPAAEVAYGVNRAIDLHTTI
jgi:hypothetical protein